MPASVIKTSSYVFVQTKPRTLQFLVWVSINKDIELVVKVMTEGNTLEV